MEKKQRYGDLLGDLIQKILVRIPDKSLGRFKMVSKSWFALIENPLFIDLHTTFNSPSSSSSSSKFGPFILLASLYKYSPKTFQTSSEHSLIMLSSESESESGSESGGCLWSTGSNHDQDDDDDQLVFKVDNNNNSGGGQQQQQLVFKLESLGFPKFCDFSKSIDDLGLPPCFKLCEFSKKIVGSCNGLVCLYSMRFPSGTLLRSTRQHRILPKAIKIVEDDFPRRLVAFGFDVETRDYKVVLLTNDFRPLPYFRPTALPIECLCRVQVYSLSTDSWSFLEGITCLPGDPFLSNTSQLVVCLNGSCFFLAHFFHTKQRPRNLENDRFIISFDLSKYIITPIQLPEHNRLQKLYLSCLGDKMAFFTVCCKPPPRGDSYYPDTYELPPPRANYSYYPIILRFLYYGQICGCEDYNIWVLDEHISSSVNKESWRRLHSFQIEHQRPGLWSSPSCISNDGEFVLIETMGLLGLGKRMKLYNLFTKEVKKDFLSCSSVMSKAYAYKPSLVKF